MDLPLASLAELAKRVFFDNALLRRRDNKSI
jgi:hypothetical protein